MTENDVLDLFRRSGALLEGHFRLPSGLHSPGYLQCALVLQHPPTPTRSARRSADAVRALGADSGAVAGARRHRHRPGSRPRARRPRHLRRARRRRADAAPRLHARRRRARAGRRGRGDDRRLDARDDRGGPRGRRDGRRRRGDRRPQRRHAGLDVPFHALAADVRCRPTSPSACPLCAAGVAGGQAGLAARRAQACRARPAGVRTLKLHARLRRHRLRRLAAAGRRARTVQGAARGRARAASTRRR